MVYLQTERQLLASSAPCLMRWIQLSLAFRIIPWYTTLSTRANSSPWKLMRLNVHLHCPVNTVTLVLLTTSRQTCDWTSVISNQQSFMSSLTKHSQSSLRSLDNNIIHLCFWIDARNLKDSQKGWTAVVRKKSCSIHLHTRTIIVIATNFAMICRLAIQPVQFVPIPASLCARHIMWHLTLIHGNTQGKTCPVHGPLQPVYQTCMAAFEEYPCL